ncbi:MAG: hypothetical protein R2834_05190 [Rhodothermales bacterium]
MNIPSVHRPSSADRAFVRDFEACAVAPADFDHAAHIRLAYVYLCEMPADRAVARVREVLQAYLAHLGMGEGKYHETLTRAWVLAVRHFMARSVPCDSAAAFIEASPRLLDTGILLTHYTAERLFSPDARAAFVDPDLQPIPMYA